MTDFKQRLLDEKSELGEKINKLNAFISSEAFQKIDPFQMSLLHIQLQAMYTYSQCLLERIIWLDTTSEYQELVQSVKTES